MVVNVESLDDTTARLQIQVTALDQRVGDLEAGGGGGSNVTGILWCGKLFQGQFSEHVYNEINTFFCVVDLTERVEALEDVTSQMNGEISEIQDDVTTLDERVSDLESGGDGSNNTGISYVFFRFVPGKFTLNYFPHF